MEDIKQKKIEKILDVAINDWQKQHKRGLDPEIRQEILDELLQVYVTRETMPPSRIEGVHRAVATYRRSIYNVFSSRPTSVEFLSLEGTDWLEELASRFIDPLPSNARTIIAPINKKTTFGYMSTSLILDYHWAT